MAEQHWPGQSFLEVLRPEPGWRVEAAILTTYSADLVTVVAAMLALAGVDNDQGSGSKVDFANAYEQLRGRLKILVQAGRISVPNQRPPILAILDQFVEEVSQDERRGSWHPKAALVKLCSEDRIEPRWRLWIGSRNLTRSFDWDAGLCLVSDSAGRGNRIDGIAELGAELARRAKLNCLSPEALYSELASVTWHLPEHMRAVPEIRLMSSGRNPGLPKPPEQLRCLYVISPFIDAYTVAQLGGWGDGNTERSLLSLRPELERTHARSHHALHGFEQLLCLDAPDPDGLNAQYSDDTDTADDEEMGARGLHAKLIYAEHAAGYTLWLGSANATRRAWEGANTEVIARLEIGPELADGLRAFVRQIAQTVILDSLDGGEAEETAADRLSRARQEVCARWQIRQLCSEEGNRLAAEAPPHPTDAEVAMSVGTLTGELVEWPRGERGVRLSRASYSLDSDFVRIRLKLDDEHVAWLQQAPLDPPHDPERDQRVLMQYLDPKTFLLWIRSLLAGDDVGDGGGDWKDTRRGRSYRSESPTWWAPTLEEILRAWSRNPENLTPIAQKVTDYLDAIKKYGIHGGDAEVAEVLDEFQTTWGTLSQVLLQERQ